VKEIAGRLNRHEHTIRNWIKAYAVNGIENLKSKDPPGRPRIKGPEVEKEIDELLIKTPREFGYQEEGWSVCILLDYFSKKQLALKEDTVRRALKKMGWVYKRFAKAVSKNAPSKEEKSQKIEQLIETIKQDNPDETLSEKVSSRIKLYFLPPYSPKYNPIERFWGWLKKHLYRSKSYERIQDVTKQMRQLIWHYQENKMTSKIHFNFDPYQKLINV
jgi:transposase